MKTEFRKASKPAELRSLEIFDRKVFHEYPADWFDRADWEAFEAWWLIVNNRKIGCCAFEQRVGRPLGKDRASLYVVSTGILPTFQGQGFGGVLKSWQIAYGRHHGFKRIVTNTRQSNLRMIRLNRKFGFKLLRTTPDYYESPREATVVMTLEL